MIIKLAGEHQPAVRTTSVYICRDRRLDRIKVLLRDVLGPGAYFFRPTGGGIDMAHSESHFVFRRQFNTQRKLGATLIVSLAHTLCHHCLENGDIPEYKPQDALNPDRYEMEMGILREMMSMSGQCIKTNASSGTRVITGIIHTHLVGDGLGAIELISPFNDSHVLNGPWCTGFICPETLHAIAV